MLRFALIVEGRGASTLMRSVSIFRANNWETAKARSVEVGIGSEQDYENVYGERVVLRLMEVETLDMISAEDLDGAEVYSEFVPGGIDGAQLTVETTFRPQDSKPAQSGI